MVQIRSAQSSDAAKLANFGEKTFRDTFEKDNTPENMALYLAKTFGADKQLAEIQDPNRRIALAFDGAELAGYYHLVIGNLDPSIAGRKPIELLRFYVDAKWHGAGVARQLMTHALESAKSEGFATFWLGVWEHNFRAQSFYKKWGFREVGEHVFELGTDPQRDLIYTLDL